VNIAIPDVVKQYDYESILQGHILEVKKIIPDWHPSEGDLMLIEKQAGAFREMHLRAEFNELARAFFLSTAKKNDLDNYATFYGLERLKGSKPTAKYKFELTSKLDYTVMISKGSKLTDDGGTKIGVLLDDIVFEVDNELKIGTVELDEYVRTSSVTLTTFQTPLPYVASISKLDAFVNGADAEDDEHFRKRILLSLADKSTAGSERTYQSYTYKADSKIEDVSVYSIVPGEVLVYVYAPSSSEHTLERVRKSLNSEDVRPLTDKLIVGFAKEVFYAIDATLKIFENRNSAQIYMNAMKSLEVGLKTIEKIGADITISELNDFLRVEGVKEVVFASPLKRLDIARNQIAICSSKKVNYEVYDEQY